MSSSSKKIHATIAELDTAFTEWERRFREEPEKFISDFARYTTTTPATYGKKCTRYFVTLLDEVKMSD